MDDNEGRQYRWVENNHNARRILANTVGIRDVPTQKNGGELLQNNFVILRIRNNSKIK